MDTAIAQLEREGYVIESDDKAPLCPLSSVHVPMLGRYSFTIPKYVARGDLGLLRDSSELINVL